MVEFGLPGLIIAAVTGLSAITTRLNSRIHELDRRLDGVELRVAENYLSKAEFSAALERVESHMIRIENKLDNLVK
jgi:outer membrane protein assembly factor BamD (BamD/ComL family)